MTCEKNADSGYKMADSDCHPCLEYLKICLIEMCYLAHCLDGLTPIQYEIVAGQHNLHLPDIHEEVNDYLAKQIANKSFIKPIKFNFCQNLYGLKVKYMFICTLIIF